MTANFETVSISSKEAMNTPSRMVFETATTYAEECLVPCDGRTAMRVYFANGRNGDEFGQFATEAEAINAARLAAQ